MIKFSEDEQKLYEQLKTQYLSSGNVSTVKQAEKAALDEIKARRKEKDAQSKESEIKARISLYEAMGLTVDYSTGRPATTSDNYCNLLERCKSQFKPLKYDDFSARIYYGETPMTDLELAIISNKMSTLAGFESQNKVWNAIQEVSHKNSFNSLTDYLTSLSWDKTPRIATMFTDYLGAAPSKLYSTMAVIWMIAAVKRAFEPGCKFDNIIIFSGPQGIGKSAFCEKLAVNPEWYCEDIEIGSKDALQQIRDSWIINMDELTSMSKKDAAVAKNFITRRFDKFRDPYGRLTNTFQRHCIFIGTTNEDVFLKDSTAVTERRYWVIKCTGERKDAIRRFEALTPEVVSQLWAEAVYYYKNADIPMYIPEEQWSDFSDDQLQYKVENDSELFIFLDDALNRRYEEFIDDGHLARQYKSGTLPGAVIRLQDKFTLNSLNMLIKDNHVYDWKGCIKQYAEMRPETWKYTTISIRGSKTKGLKRVGSEDTQEETKSDIFSI